jgi:hypothetical protein
MRQTVLDNSKEDRARFDHLLKDADVFFANRRPGCLEAYAVSCRERKMVEMLFAHLKCQSASNFAPRSASKIDPHFGDAR